MGTTESSDTPPLASPPVVPGASPPTEGPHDDESAVATDANADLERAVLPTVVSPGVARAVIVAFCVMLAVIPAVQIVLESTGRHRAQLATLFHRAPTRENLHQYEQDVAANSVFKQYVQPRLQLALSETTGAGNGKIFIGREGVLFYRPGMDFVTGRGILDPGRLRMRRKHMVDAGEHSAEPDPRPAIFAFDAACRSAGVHLVLVPVPDKVTVMPAAAGIAEGRTHTPIVNVDFPRFLAELKEAGVDVFDPLSLAATPDQTERYLKQDTHWTPQSMETVAEGIAGHLRARAVLSAGDPGRFRAEDVAVRRVGDLVDMLGLPTDQTLFPPQEVTVRQTVDAKTGALAVAQPSADVLLLGDSFANIYTAPQMGWGEAAGLGPTLARHLGRDVDAIVINGSGASGTRRELARRPEGLSGKRVVVWEFAVRELTDSSWDVIPMSGGSSASPAPSEQRSKQTAALVLDATIDKVSKVPDPYSVPYPDCLTYMMLRVDRVVEGKCADDRVLVVMWAMKKNKLLPPAKYAPGQRLRVKLIPLREADDSVKTGQRADDTADYDHRPYFVIEEQTL
jgi:hypothetical protein